MVIHFLKFKFVFYLRPKIEHFIDIFFSENLIDRFKRIEIIFVSSNKYKEWSPNFASNIKRI